MKRANLLCVLIMSALLLIGCGKDNEDELTIKYSDDSLSVEYNGESVEYDFGTEAETEAETVPEYDPEMVIDLFEDVEDWLVYEGADGKGKVELIIPDDYEKEIGGYYFKSSGNQYSLNIIYDNEFFGSIDYDIRNGNNLSQGDIFKVTMFYFNFDRITEDINLTNIFAPTGHIVLTDNKEFLFPARGQYLEQDDMLTESDIDVVIEYMNTLHKTDFNRRIETTDYVVDAIYDGTVKNGFITEYDSKRILTVFSVHYVDNIAYDIVRTYLYDLYRDLEGNIVIGNHRYYEINNLLAFDVKENLFDSYNHDLIYLRD